MSTSNLVRIPPFTYIHILDNNSTITRIEIGPATYVKKENETIVLGPKQMIRLKPRTYCIIQDPIVFVDGKPAIIEFSDPNEPSKKLKTYKNRFGDREIRTAEKWQDPFPLYPGEILIGQIESLQVIQKDKSLKLRAVRDFFDEDFKVERKAGDQWVRIGPFTYGPRIEEKIVETISAQVIKPNTALLLQAEQNMVDVYGNERKAGEQWLIRENGSYLPQVQERVLKTVQGRVLTDKKALQVKALSDFKDAYGIKRKAGEEWLVTNKMTQVHIQDVYEEIVREISVTALSGRQYCVVLNPYDLKTKANRYGARELRKGELTFFLQPDEYLEKGVQEIEVLGEDEALLLRANEDFEDKATSKKKLAGETWLIHGPCEYIPPVQVDIVQKRKKLPLDENEGIYVRDKNSGEVRIVKGVAYLLKADEELWEKELPTQVEILIAQQITGSAYIPPKINAKGELVYEQYQITGYIREKHKVVTYRAPHNTAVQLYDYKTKQSRVVFGPDLVLLGPDEHFTLVVLSAGKPKVEGVIRSLVLNLGPDFMSDIVIVETLDHARLQLQLSYNWHFNYDRNNKQANERLFSVKDFVGDACKSIASRVRGAVSAITFEDFHTKSSTIIRAAVFGKDKDDTIRNEYEFKTNGLVMTSVDIQSMEPVDVKTRESLEKSVTLAIDISTKAQEAASDHQAKRLKQESDAELERQELENQARIEEANKLSLIHI
eukprot:TRINITY_DN493_c0_g1_i9.p1 TRINITY_DN493_c0_g1~~TRINITY_DN493_c0_g1_i9.p1  ORF type:complete len:718 (+),score=194.36 TRINITY_DN493_c0_g1_i9:218-2371(+)